jgi:hypothetical protein
MVSAPWLGSGLRLRLCQVAAWNVRGSAADRERLVDDVRDRLLGYPPLPARLPGVGGAGYRVFTANGSLNRTRLAPKAVCTRPAPRLRGHEGHIGRQPPASDHASWPGEPATCRAGATCQGARVPGLLPSAGEAEPGHVRGTATWLGGPDAGDLQPYVASHDAVRAGATAKSRRAATTDPALVPDGGAAPGPAYGPFPARHSGLAARLFTPARSARHGRRRASTLSACI